MLTLLLWTGTVFAADVLERPSFVVVITDDQRFDSLGMMAGVQEDLVGPGLSFERAYVSTPLCCPFRASLLSGGFPSRETGLLTNEGGNGGPGRFVDAVTLATRFQDAGYATGLSGKYLTNYDTEIPRIPPGWTSFQAITTIETWWNHQTLEGSSGALESEGVLMDHTTYITHTERDGALAFIDAHAGEPFLLFVTLAAPHFPWTPLSKDKGSHADVVHRPPAFNEDDVSDKPPWLQAIGPLDSAEVSTLDHQVQAQLDCLLSIDRTTTALIDRLDAHGILDQTHVILTSDNGFMWGEHRLMDKGLPYEESARVPLVWRGPGVVAGSLDTPVLVDLDLPATLAELAGIAPHTWGESLVPALAGEVLDRGPLRLENLAPARFPSWSAVVDDQLKLIAWSDGVAELYDLAADPGELESVAGDPALADQQAALQALIDADHGLTMPPQELDDGQVDVAYACPLTALGGVPPYVWSALTELPPGLVLDSAGGVSGVPNSAGTWHFTVLVIDSGESPQSGLAHAYQRKFVFDIAPADDPNRWPEGFGCGVVAGAAGLVWLLPLWWLGCRRRDQAD